jgi:guanosine-3',5'-bis(diphosphate) 3'-pyrophosphohydrolase
MNPTLEAVKRFAEKAHGDQRRKYSDERYITHPIRVMETCMNYTDDDCMLAAALLHDVLEDTTVTQNEMGEFLRGVMTPEAAARTLELVVELTDIYTKKNYPGLNRRARKSKEAERLSHVSGDAQTIKYADIIDNATNIFVHDPDFAIVFIQEGKWVLKRMLKGDSELYDRAMKVVTDCLELMDDRQVMDRLK